MRFTKIHILGKKGSKGVISPLLLASFTGVILVLLITSISSFRNGILGMIFHKPTTSAQTASVTFNAVGDFGVSNTTTKPVLQSIGTSGASFTLALGDLSYNTLTALTSLPNKYTEPTLEGRWCHFVKDNVGSTHPFELISGNHEQAGQNVYIDRFVKCLPDRIGGLLGTYGKEYYFDYQGMVRFIMISPNIWFWDQFDPVTEQCIPDTVTNVCKQTNWSYISGNSHYNWVSQKIDEARNNNIPWVIVGMHEPCISLRSGSNCPIGQAVMNLLISKRVDLVLQGHDHSYERTKQLAYSLPNCSNGVVKDSYNSSCVASDGGLSNIFNKGDGTIFAIVGNGGASAHTNSSSDAEVGYFDTWAASTTYGYLKIDVSSSQLSAGFIKAAGNTFTDNFSIVNQSSLTPTPTAVSTVTPTPISTPTPTSTPIPTATPTPNPGGQMVYDTFTEAGAYLENHTSDSGASWVNKLTCTTTSCKAVIYVSTANPLSNLLRPAGSSRSLYYANVVPAAAEYDVYSDLYVASQQGFGGLAARIDPSADTYYYAVYNASDSAWKILKRVAGSVTTLKTFAEPISVGSIYSIKFEIRDASKKLYVNGILKASTTDNTILGPGRIGVTFNPGVTPSDTIGYHLDNFSAQ